MLQSSLPQTVQFAIPDFDQKTRFNFFFKKQVSLTHEERIRGRHELTSSLDAAHAAQGM